jgi:hypothetical protein
VVIPATVWSTTSGTPVIASFTAQGTSGTFEFVAYDGFDMSKVIAVTDGKFTVTFD